MSQELDPQKQLVRDISRAMLAIGKQAIHGHISLGKIDSQEGMSLMADISTEVYIQCLSDLAYLSKGRDKNTKDFIKSNNSIACKKAVSIYDLKAKQREEAYGKLRRV